MSNLNLKFGNNRMSRIFWRLLFLSLLGLVSCDQQRVEELAKENTQLKDKLSRQQTELRQVRSELAALQQTDNYLYQKAVTFRTQKEFMVSNWWLTDLAERFPSSPLLKEANALRVKNEKDYINKLFTSAEDMRAQGNFTQSNRELLKIEEQFPNTEDAARARKLKAENEKGDAELVERAYRESSQLELIDWNWGQSTTSHVTAKGQVKNISGSSLKSVMALVTWYDKNGGFITSDSSLIEYNPILPGQVSPFSVIETFNPAMQNASVEFKELRGTQLTTYHKKKGKK